MGDSIGCFGALLVGAALLVSFFVFSARIGALAAFGRHPLSWKKLGLLTAAAFVPGVGTVGAFGLLAVVDASTHPAAAGLGMAMTGWACATLLGMLYNLDGRASRSGRLGQ